MFRTKKALFVTLCAVLVIVIIIGLSLIWYYQIRPLQIYDFSLEDYARHLKEFPSDEVVGSIADFHDAKKKAVAVLTDIYSEKVISDEKPFIVSYDENSDSWLISGTKSPVPFMFGGVAHIIINGADGNVLAVWHEK